MRRRFGQSLFCVLLLLASADLAAQSLFTAQSLKEGTLYSDQVARQPGDLVTIRVVENMTLEDKQETTLDRSNEASLVLEQVPFTTRTASNGGGLNAMPGLALNSAKTFEGEGEYKQSGKMVFSLSGRVIDVLDNGNMVIEARRTMTINNDSKTVLLTGVCRPADIDPGNVLPSTSLHNFEVSVVGEGPLSRQQQEGILGRLLDILWPF